MMGDAAAPDKNYPMFRAGARIPTRSAYKSA
jgi:hypothetical protein